MPELFHLLENPVFWVSLSTLFVTGALIKILTPVVTKAMDKRAAEISEELERAVALREEAQVILAQYQKKQRESLKEAEEIVQKANYPRGGTGYGRTAEEAHETCHGQDRASRTSGFAGSSEPYHRRHRCCFALAGRQQIDG